MFPGDVVSFAVRADRTRLTGPLLFVEGGVVEVLVDKITVGGDKVLRDRSKNCFRGGVSV